MAMTFKELWERVPGLSKMAKEQVPDALSADTKNRLERYSPFEIGALVRAAIDEIEQGSAETLDALVTKRLS